MENCTIYSHQLQFQDIVTLVKEELPKGKVDYKDGGKQKSLIATIKGGLFSKTKTLKINYRERENPSYKLDKVECGLTQNLSGMVNFIQSIPASNPELRNKFLYKVMSANCEIPFMAEPVITPEFEKVLKKIINKLDAFVFVQPSKLFGKSNGQHFLDKELNLIIDTSGKMEVSDVSVVVDAKYHDGPTDNYSDEQIARKERSESVLHSKEIKVNKNLPCLTATSDTSLRTKEEIIDRVYALLIIAAYGEGITKEQLKKPIEDKSINSFSPQEQSVLNLEELNDQQKAYATWRYESLYVLLWSLNFFSELKFASEICDVKTIVSKVLQPSRDEFILQAKLRETNEIMDELDKTYRMNWACVDARIKAEQVGGSINPSVIYERHYALNWLTKYQDQAWDDVQTNT
jgi:hypothetical protein